MGCRRAGSEKNRGKVRGTSAETAQKETKGKKKWVECNKKTLAQNKRKANKRHNKRQKGKEKMGEMQ